jgi:peptidyl-prolyl cis-trans isomerase B (cyclophilin B)
MKRKYLAGRAPAFAVAVMVGCFIGMVGLNAFAAEADKEQPSKNPVVLMTTSEGPVKIELWPDKAPITVKNFLRYAEEGFYDGTIFHRVIDDFMIQGGGFTPDMKQKKPHEPIKNEASADLKNERGTIAMARTNVVDSASSQFFINVKDNTSLNHRDDSQAGYGYAVFGKVVEGMDVVDRIKKVKTTTVGPFQNVPAKPVMIESVKLVN